MIVSGPNKYVRLFIEDITAGGGRIDDFIQMYNDSNMMRLLVESLYPNIHIKVRR